GHGGPDGPSAPVARAASFTAMSIAPALPQSASAPAERPRRRFTARLLADAQSVDQGLVALLIDRTEVIEEPPPLADELEEPAPAVVILLVRLEVLRQVGDPLR